MKPTPITRERYFADLIFGMKGAGDFGTCGVERLDGYAPSGVRPERAYVLPVLSDAELEALYAYNQKLAAECNAHLRERIAPRVRKARR